MLLPSSRSTCFRSLQSFISNPTILFPSNYRKGPQWGPNTLPSSSWVTCSSIHQSLHLCTMVVPPGPSVDHISQCRRDLGSWVPHFPIVSAYGPLYLISHQFVPNRSFMSSLWTSGLPPSSPFLCQSDYKPHYPPFIPR